jgi:hypothetical protein
VHPGDEIAERGQSILRLANCGVEMLPGPLGVGGECSLGELEIDQRRDELLLRSVVEIAGKPLTSAVSVGKNSARGLAIRVLTSSYLRLAHKNQSSALCVCTRSSCVTEATPSSAMEQSSAVFSPKLTPTLRCFALAA